MKQGFPSGNRQSVFRTYGPSLLYRFCTSRSEEFSRGVRIPPAATSDNPRAESFRHLHFFERAERFLHGHFGIDSVQFDTNRCAQGAVRFKLLSTHCLRYSGRPSGTIGARSLVGWTPFVAITAWR